MGLPKRYDPGKAEPAMIERWQEDGVYHFDPAAEGPVYSIDTPPPTVSGNLHLGHVYSYSHADFLARFWRMRGQRVFYPMGYDDNGLPTERLVERQLGITATDVGRRAFIEKCLQVSEEAEVEYEALWKRLGLSIDWRYTYRTIDDLSRRTSQLSFLDLHNKGYVYRREAPSIWCPECRTAIAQAELNDLDRGTEFVTLRFKLEDGADLPIATTRPELLPACVAIFVHPEDERFRDLVGKQATVPLFGQSVPILEDPEADPEKGTGVVMCCTFGDQTDVAWWYTHDLEMVEGIDREGRLTEAAGDFAGLSITEGRKRIIEALAQQDLIGEREASSQSVRVHERCDTPVEYMVTKQWFINALDHKETLLEAGENLHWYPDHMRSRYRAWVEGLSWDWCISRQRYFGVPFPVWYCAECGDVVLASEEQLPVDPTDESPQGPCSCGSAEFVPEEDVMDTWATSSLSPQIVARWLADEQLYQQTFPMTMRPQAHEIIRTWAFYTILKSVYHFDLLPWRDVLISGWGLAGPGMPKVSKSRGGGPMPPMEMIERYSADAVRYWASSTGPGKDSIISEEKIQLGSKLVTKLWNVARFSERFLEEYRPGEAIPDLTSADRWILSQLQRLIARATDLFENYDYAASKSETEAFFWGDLADNYVEMAKQRLYDAEHPNFEGARFTLHRVLRSVLKLFAPLMPHVTEEIYQGLFLGVEGVASIHLAPWPRVDERLLDETALEVGGRLVELATAVRRYKSERSLKLSLELARLQLAVQDGQMREALEEAASDLMSVTRALRVEVVSDIDAGMEMIYDEDGISAALEL